MTETLTISGFSVNEPHPLQYSPTNPDQNINTSSERSEIDHLNPFTPDRIQPKSLTQGFNNSILGRISPYFR
jgi:hypothetical protein